MRLHDSLSETHIIRNIIGDAKSQRSKQRSQPPILLLLLLVREQSCYVGLLFVSFLRLQCAMVSCHLPYMYCQGCMLHRECFCLDKKYCFFYHIQDSFLKPPAVPSSVFNLASHESLTALLRVPNNSYEKKTVTIKQQCPRAEKAPKIVKVQPRIFCNIVLQVNHC